MIDWLAIEADITFVVYNTAKSVALVVPHVYKQWKVENEFKRAGIMKFNS